MRLRSLALAAFGGAVLTLGVSPMAFADDDPDCSGLVADRVHWAHEQAEDRGIDGEAAHGAECTAALVDPTSESFVLRP